MGIYRRVTNVVRRAATVGVNGPHELSVNPISFISLHLDLGSGRGDRSVGCSVHQHRRDGEGSGADSGDRDSYTSAAGEWE